MEQVCGMSFWGVYVERVCEARMWDENVGQVYGVSMSVE